MPGVILNTQLITLLYLIDVDYDQHLSVLGVALAHLGHDIHEGVLVSAPAILALLLHVSYNTDHFLVQRGSLIFINQYKGLYQGAGVYLLGKTTNTFF